MGAGGSSGTPGPPRAPGIDVLEAQGFDVPGEVRLLASLTGPPARVLDVGCGTGRTTTMFTRLGYRCVGVDIDENAVAEARRHDPATRFVHGDLAELYLNSQAFDVTLLAHEVLSLLPPGALLRAMSRVAAHTRGGGLVVAGFGLDADHLPSGGRLTTPRDYDTACVAAGLTLAHRWSSWFRDPWRDGSRYVVSVHRRG